MNSLIWTWRQSKYLHIYMYSQNVYAFHRPSNMSAPTILKIWLDQSGADEGKSVTSGIGVVVVHKLAVDAHTPSAHLVSFLPLLP